MIRLRDVHKSYVTNKVKNVVLRGVDLEIEDGQFVAILGRSGSGKTTLLNVVGGLDGDYEGEVIVDGRDLAKLSDDALSDYRNRNVGFVFQGFHLLNHMTCAENVALPAIFERADATDEDVRKRALEVLEHVGIPEKADELPPSLSGGQKQRVAIARALFNRPKVLICDEPTGNLDRRSGASIVQLFHQLNDDDGITFLIVTHDDIVARGAGRTVHIEDGRIAEPQDAGDANDTSDGQSGGPQ